ncbi:MAG TPA: M24 family metallopeptidase [Longimicrobiales bacterium]
MDSNNVGGFAGLRERCDEIQAALRELGLDGWLLYDLHARNSVAASLLGLGDLTRRYFVHLPAHGEPQAIVHGIEQAPWAQWPWPKRVYVGWRELDAALRETLAGARRIAMEVSAGDAVPSLDLVPAGVVELVQAAGPEIASSGELITRFYSRWTAEALASHRRAAEVVAGVARDAFQHVAAAIEAGEEITEGGLHAWVTATLADRGCGVGADCIAANGIHAADPHYAAVGAGAAFGRGDVILLDLWGKESEDAIFADQTWMAYLGESVPDRVNEVWTAVRDARDGAVDFLRRQSAGGVAVQGSEVDDVARGIIADRGFGAAFIHRTGHSIDRSLHGMGPNIDNLETRETRRLVAGVGFSIEPGIYLPGELGIRSEINVYLGEDGPEVTPRNVQSEIFTLFGA